MHRRHCKWLGSRSAKIEPIPKQMRAKLLLPGGIRLSESGRELRGRGRTPSRHCGWDQIWAARPERAGRKSFVSVGRIGFFRPNPFGLMGLRQNSGFFWCNLGDRPWILHKTDGLILRHCKRAMRARLALLTDKNLRVLGGHGGHDLIVRFSAK